jgi:endonuclease VIII
VEGPSLHLAAEQLQPFAGQRIERVSGNSKIGIERLAGQTVNDIFAWGKHLVFQFHTFALRVHFMLWGTFAATVEGESVTGDYRRTGPPRLVLDFSNGEITIWAASVRFVEDPDAKAAYDFSADVMAHEWDGRAALKKVRAFPRAEIADVLLDQAIFAGVGNIIKNEVLFRTRVSPFAKVRNIPAGKLRAIVADARTFSFRFLELRRIFSLRKNLEVYRRSVCPRCGGKIERRVHGQRARRSFFCRTCQRVRISESSRTSTPHSRTGTSTRSAVPRGAAARTRRARPRARG